MQKIFPRIYCSSKFKRNFEPIALELERIFHDYRVEWQNCSIPTLVLGVHGVRVLCIKNNLIGRNRTKPHPFLFPYTPAFTSKLLNSIYSINNNHTSFHTQTPVHNIYLKWYCDPYRKHAYIHSMRYEKNEIKFTSIARQRQHKKCD